MLLPAGRGRSIGAGVRALPALLLLAACQRAAPVADTPGSRLEATAMARGLVADSGAALTGSWARDTDRVCIVPAGDAYRIGASVDYGEGQGCAASGTVRRVRSGLRVELGGCRFEAGYDGERISFPAELPAACDRFCSGRASLSALAVERLSESVSEAQTVRGPNGRLLCGG